MGKLSVKDVNLAQKKVLMRVDFNVSIDKETGRITDDTRIKASIPTIKYILKKDASLVLMSHLGRPKGKMISQLKMDKVAQRLSDILGKKVEKLDSCVGSEVEKVVNNLKVGEIVLLENTRFYKEETENNLEFAKKLARLGDIYVNDAFGTAHRAHASTVGVARFLPAVAGLLMVKELGVLSNVLANPVFPFIAILGGAKVSDKIGVLRNLSNECQEILIGGGMAYTFLRAKGISTGNSLVEEDKIEEAKKILVEAESKNCRVLLPQDHIVAPECSSGVRVKTVSQKNIPLGWMALDIGPRSIKYFSQVIDKAKTIFWNGPLGYFEIDEFSEGTREIAKKLTQVDATVVVGGGDSIAALKKENLLDRISYVSTGGGASLEFLEGKQLPGVAVLKDKK